MTDIWDSLEKIDCDNCSVVEDCDSGCLCAEWLTEAKPELSKLKVKAEKWDEFCKCLNWLNDPPIEIPLRQLHALNIGNQDKKKKLEAIKTLLEAIESDKDRWSRKAKYTMLRSNIRKILEGDE